MRRLAVFGSAMREDFDPARSDLDFLVEFETPAPGQYASTYFGFSDGLERLLGRRVDLIEKGAIRNPYVRRQIEKERVTAYAA